MLFSRTGARKFTHSELLRRLEDKYSHVTRKAGLAPPERAPGLFSAAERLAAKYRELQHEIQKTPRQARRHRGRR